MSVFHPLRTFRRSGIFEIMEEAEEGGKGQGREAGVSTYLWRLLPMTVVSFFFFLFVIALPSDDISLTGSSWRDLGSLALILLPFSFAAAAILDWGDRRKRRQSPGD
jgi:hypothetical protein